MILSYNTTIIYSRKDQKRIRTTYLVLQLVCVIEATLFYSQQNSNRKGI